jgi:hypothetical protein
MAIGERPPASGQDKGSRLAEVMAALSLVTDLGRGRPDRAKEVDQAH